MKKFENVQSIKFNVTFNGQGCVNFDSGEQKWFLSNNKLLHSTYNNVMYAKKIFVPIDDGSVGFKYKVSSECLRHEIFKKEIPAQNSGIQNTPLIYNVIAEPEFIMRGYVWTVENGNAFKKKSCLTITDAIEKTNNIRKSIALDFHSSSGEKVQKTGDENEKSDTSIYKVENVGNIKYNANGFIDLTELQFIPNSTTYDRTSCGTMEEGSKNEKIFLDSISRNLINMQNPKMKYYYMKGAYHKDEWGEYGLLLNEESVDIMVKYVLNNIKNIMITRRGSMFEYEEMNVTVIMDNGVTHSFNLNDVDLNDLYFSYKLNYLEASDEKIIENSVKFEEYKNIAKSEKTKNKTKKQNTND